MRLGLATPEMRLHQAAIETLTGTRAALLKGPRPFAVRRPAFDALAGWAAAARSCPAKAWAMRHAIPYWTVAPGFLPLPLNQTGGSVRSYIIDRTGIYYDTWSGGDLERRILARSQGAQGAGEDGTRARAGMALLRAARLGGAFAQGASWGRTAAGFGEGSGSASGPGTAGSLGMDAGADRPNRVLVVDQPKEAASIAGAMANDQSFLVMLQAAADDNPQAHLCLRLAPEPEPEPQPGRTAADGHYSAQVVEELAHAAPRVQAAKKSGRLTFLTGPLNDRALLESCAKVYTVSSALGFEALLAGCEVHCFGVPFYAGYGLTRERLAHGPRRRKPVALEALFAAAAFDYTRYIDVDSGEERTFESLFAA